MDAQEVEAAAESGGENEVAPTTVGVAAHSDLSTAPATTPATPEPVVMTPATFSPVEESRSDASSVLADTTPDPAK